MLVTRCLPRISNGLANTTATLGSFYWLGFETSGLSPDKKRLAWLGAQQYIGSVEEASNWVRSGKKFESGFSGAGLQSLARFVLNR